MAVFRSLPPRDPNFTGRDGLLDELAGRLSGSVTALVPQALHGMGGVGKTLTAVEYAYRHQADYDLVAWIPAQQPAQVRSALARLAPDLDVAVHDDVNRTVAAVLDALRQGWPYARWLVVFDNAEDPAELRPFVPTGGHVLVTSRDQAWERVAEVAEVDVFSRAESVALLNRRAKGSIAPADAEQLADRLGDLPLAVETAAAWHAATGMPVADYLRLLDERPGDVLTDDPGAGETHSVATVWQVSLARLEQQSPAAAQMLRLCAFFGPEPISVQLLRYGRHADLPEPLASAVGDELWLRRAIGQVDRYALARVRTETDALQVHRLVQTVLREGLTPQERTAMRHRVHQILDAASPRDSGNPDTWATYAMITPHVLPSGAIHGATEQAQHVVLEQLNYLYSWGDFEGRGDLARFALDGWHGSPGWRQTLGEDHEATLRVAAARAASLRDLGEVAEARTMQAANLAVMRRVLGDDHPLTLNTAGSVAANLRLSGDFHAAHAHDTTAADGYRRVLGPDDPNTLRAASNLAVSLRFLGRFAEARHLDDDTLNRCRRVLARWDSLIVTVLGSLAHDHWGLGGYATARQLLTEQIPQFEARLGASHARVLEAVRTLGVTERRLGNHPTARQLAGRVFEGFTDRYGPQHHDTLTVQHTLVTDLRLTGDLAEARSLGEQALVGHRAWFGTGHPLTCACAVNLAIVLRATGDADAARALDETALAGLRAALGDDHPYTMSALANFTNDLSAAGEPQLAREHSEAVYERSTRVRGPDHPDTLACAVNLAIDLRVTGDAERADRLRYDTVTRLERLRGAEHPATTEAVKGRRAETDIEPSPL